MKNSHNLQELQQTRKKVEEEAWIHPPICMICNKKIQGFHGRWGTVGTCNSACERVQAAKPPYPGHSEEDFFERMKNASTT